jgi:hypothetical protein
MWIALAIVVAVVAVISLVFAIKLGLRLFTVRRMLGELGAGGKVAFYGSLIYAFFPVDLLPDPIYLDDIGVLAAAVAYLTHLVRKHRSRAVKSLSPEASSPPQRGPRSRR